MKINKKVIVLILIISLSNIQSASFGFQMLKKNFMRKNNSFTNNNNNNYNKWAVGTQSPDGKTITETIGPVSIQNQGPNDGQGNLNMSISGSSNLSHSSSSSTCIACSYFAVSSAIGATKKVKSSISDSSYTETMRMGDIHDYDIYYDGWIKYLHYSDSTTKRKEFFKNTRYALESRLSNKNFEKDEV